MLIALTHILMVGLLSLGGQSHDVSPADCYARDAVRVYFPEAAIVNINTIYVPFTLAGQLIITRARVDTLEGNFVFDTGAERLLLNANYFSGTRFDREVVSTGNTGLVASVRRTTLDSLHIDQLYFAGAQADIADLTHIEDSKNTRILGILGYRLYQDFEVFIDFPNRRLVLSRVDKDGTRLDSFGRGEMPLDSIDFTLRGHVIIVAAQANGAKIQMMLDSGAELNLLDRRVKRKVLDGFTILKRVNLTGAGNRQVEVLAGSLEGVQLGRQQCERMNTLLTSMDAINEAFGVSLDGVLGYEFLYTRRVLINYQKEKIYFFGPWRP